MNIRNNRHLRMPKGFSLILFLLPLFLVACGDKAGDEGTEAERVEGEQTEQTVAESTTADATTAEGEGTSRMLELRKELMEILLNIETVEDAKAADASIGKVFDGMVDVIEGYKDNPAAASAVQNDPEVRELERRMNEHMQKVSAENPKVGLEIASIMMKHSGKLMKASMELMQSEQVQEAMKGAQKQLEDVSKQLEKAKGGE